MLFELSSTMLFQRTGKVTGERVLFGKLATLLPCAFSDLSISDLTSKRQHVVGLLFMDCGIYFMRYTYEEDIF